MRVVWKDSAPKTKPWIELKYRNYTISQYGDGWVTNIPGDQNIYFPRESAFNAIDKALGGSRRNKKEPERVKLGINIIGRKDDVS
jgi:hypothetical protein